MTANLSASDSRLLVILDLEFGDRLREVWAGQPIWIDLSPTNEPVVRSLWESGDHPDFLTGITGILPRPNITGEEHFLIELDTIDLHHGPYSTSTPYTELEVIGCPLSPPVRAAVAELGFAEFEERPDGFVARRSPEAAAVRRP